MNNGKNRIGEPVSRGRSCAGSAARTNRVGWTLLDISITVLILGILSTIAVPRFWDAIERNRAEATAHRLQADLLWARQHAMASSTTVTVEFRTDVSRYSIPQLDHPDSPGQPYGVDVSAYPYQSSILRADFSGHTRVRFDRFGYPDSGGTVIVRCGGYQQSVTLAAQGTRATIP